MTIYYNTTYKWFSYEGCFIYMLDKQYSNKGYAIYVGEPVVPSDYPNDNLVKVNGLLLKNKLYKIFKRYS